jgi:hypothetical protein
MCFLLGVCAETSGADASTAETAQRNKALRQAPILAFILGPVLALVLALILALMPAYALEGARSVPLAWGGAE